MFENQQIKNKKLLEMKMIANWQLLQKKKKKKPDINQLAIEKSIVRKHEFWQSLEFSMNA